jgi:dTDP-4-amino-4,6-dideoxygalactose transaminase
VIHPVPFHRVLLTEDDIGKVERTLRSGWLTTGPEVKAFEEEFAQYVGAREAVAVSSGTAAIHLMLLSTGIGPGDEVIVPTYTFTASAATVAHVGARPVLADIDPDNLCLTASEVERHLTPRTRAVMAVHFAGVHCDLAEIGGATEEYTLILEDAAHALPCWRNGAHAGSQNDGAAFSFYATKPLSAGEGGMLTLSDVEQVRRARKLMLHGMSKGALDRYDSGSWRYNIDELGYKYNMADPVAALARSQLLRVASMRDERHAIAQAYDAAFGKHSGLQTPFRRGGSDDSWHLYVLRLNLNRLDCTRDVFLENLRARGIGGNVHFIPLHLHSAYQSKYGYRPGDFPIAEREFERAISLPIWPGMSLRDISAVIENVLELADGYAKK